MTVVTQKISIFFIFSIFLQLFSCRNFDLNHKGDVIIDLRNQVYWTESDAKSTPEEAERLNFHKFDTSGIGNIVRTAGKNHDYIWLRLFFYTPEPLKDKTLGLFISYLHFADKVWVNGVYVGGYGTFPPNEWSSPGGSHIYTIPPTLIDQQGRNTILIKVYNRGKSGISNNIKLGLQERMESMNVVHTFFQSILYLFAAGGMFFTAILFLLIFIWRKKERGYLTFSLICLASLIFILPFFASHLPHPYTNPISYTLFVKLTLCLGFYLLAFFLATLVIEFVKKGEGTTLRTVRLSILIFCTLITFAIPDYNMLEKIPIVTLPLSIINILLGFGFVFLSKKTPEEKKALFNITIAFTPFLIAIPIDLLIKGFFKKVDSPYATIFGWLITVLNFLVIMSVRYNKAMAQNEYLNVKLRREVLKQTKELSKKNLTLEEELERSATDLEMASLVQKKFFPYPPHSLPGWDIAVSYSPLDKVSGDMYDYYMENGSLKGFSLFDVSGHGIAASLVTMLAKNIVFQAFIRNMKKEESVTRTLYEINDEIIEAKGEIENYLTGLMFRFGQFNENDECLVEMANAGHPNPILFSAKSKICDELESPEGEDHHGAIGLDFITVSFPQINFTMAEDDILLFYTDGLSESRNTKGEMFGKERIKHILKENYAKNAQSIMEELIDSYHEFTNGTKRDDDITVVVMKRENSANYIEELDEV